jgi:hypothetical protein
MDGRMSTSQGSGHRQQGLWRCQVCWQHTARHACAAVWGRAPARPRPPPPPRPPLLGCMAAPAHPWHLQVHPLANVEVQDVPKVRVSHEHHKGVINTPVVTNGKTCTAQTGGGGRATHRHVSQSHPCRHARQLLACWYARSCLHVDMCAMTTDSTLTRMKTAAL